MKSHIASLIGWGDGSYFMGTYIELSGHFLELDRAELARLAKVDRTKVISGRHLGRP